MTITVKFIGAFRSASGVDKITVPIKENEALKHIISGIAEEIPELKRVLVDPQLRGPRPNALILVNGKEISVLRGLETTLKDGDEIVLVPVLHGG
jgi:MoaD family protein